jgi:hypothetical protein
VPLPEDAKSLLYKSLLNKVEEVSPATKIRFVKGYLERARKRRHARIQAGARNAATRRMPMSVTSVVFSSGLAAWNRSR